MFARPKIIFTGWSITRAIAVYAAVQTARPVSGWLADVALYNWWAENISNGQFPLNDPMWQYPPLAAVVFCFAHSLGPGTIGFVAFAVFADLGIMALIMKHAKKLLVFNPFAPWIWVAAPIFIGPIMFGRFDIFPTLAMIAALILFTSPTAFGSLVALGALLKVWPVLGLIATPRASASKVFSAFAVTFISGSMILVAWWPGSFSFIAGQRSRGLQIESVGALPYMIWNAGPKDIKIELLYGAVEVVASGTRLVCILVTLIGAGLLGSLVWRRYRGDLEHIEASDLTLLAVLISMVTSRVLSPQYIVWVVALIAVCAFKPQRNFVWIASLILTSSLCGSIIYPAMYIEFEVGKLLPVAIHTIRIVTLVAATYLCWSNLKVKPVNLGRAQKASELVG